jgi:hypothetical protein
MLCSIRDPLGVSVEEDALSYTLSFAEIEGQHVELLPARTVMSMYSMGGGGCHAGNGGEGEGGIGINLLNIALLGDQENNAGNGIGGNGGSCK